MCNHIVILKENPNSQMARAQSGKCVTYLSTNLNCGLIQVVQSRKKWMLHATQSGQR